jgi:4'-phosphopantetheinyl transferase
MGNSLLQNNVKWEPYQGQDLGVTEFAHIFVIRTDIYPDAPAQLAGILSTDESNRASRFFHKADRTNFIIRRALLRQLAGRILGKQPADIQFQRRQNKKPIVAGLEFSVSHTKNYAAIAIGSTALGIDIEYTDPDFEFRPILAAHFSQAEISFIEDGENQLLNFYTVWTRKEAILKATGEGLVNDLNKVPVLQNRLIRNETDYLLHSLVINDHCLMSFASGYTLEKLNLWLIESPISF